MSDLYERRPPSLCISGPPSAHAQVGAAHLTALHAYMMIERKRGSARRKRANWRSKATLNGAQCLMRGLRMIIFCMRLCEPYEDCSGVVYGISLRQRETMQ